MYLCCLILYWLRCLPYIYSPTCDGIVPARPWWSNIFCLINSINIFFSQTASHPAVDQKLLLVTCFRLFSLFYKSTLQRRAQGREMRYRELGICKKTETNERKINVIRSVLYVYGSIYWIHHKNYFTTHNTHNA